MHSACVTAAHWPQGFGSPEAVRPFWKSGWQTLQPGWVANVVLYLHWSKKL